MSGCRGWRSGWQAALERVTCGGRRRLRRGTRRYAAAEEAAGHGADEMGKEEKWGIFLGSSPYLYVYIIFFF